MSRPRMAPSLSCERNYRLSFQFCVFIYFFQTCWRKFHGWDRWQPSRNIHVLWWKTNIRLAWWPRSSWVCSFNSLFQKFFFDFEPYRRIVSTSHVLHNPIVCSSCFGAIILQIFSSVHTPNETYAAGTAFAIAYKVCSVPSLLPIFFLLLMVISLVRSWRCDTRKYCHILRPCSVSGTIFKSNFNKWLKFFFFSL